MKFKSGILSGRRDRHPANFQIGRKLNSNETKLRLFHRLFLYYYFFTIKLCVQYNCCILQKSQKKAKSAEEDPNERQPVPVSQVIFFSFSSVKSTILFDMLAFFLSPYCRFWLEYVIFYCLVSLRIEQPQPICSTAEC